MPDNMRSVVVRHVLSSAENLSLAVDIAGSFGAVQSEVIRRALDRLTTSLGTFVDTKYLRISNGLGDRPLSQYESYRVSDTRWPTEVEICLEPQKPYARDICVGAVHKNPASWAGLSSSLTSALGGEQASNNWVWWRYLGGDLRNWDTKEALLQLFDEEGGAVEKIANEFKDIYGALDEHFGSGAVGNGPAL